MKSGLPRIIGAALIAAACNDTVSPPGGHSPGGPLFSFSPNGITFRTDNGAMNYTGRLIRKGFDHRDANGQVIHPLPGDAVVATFYWIGAPNIIDSVSDVYTDAQFTPIGNSYHLVDYVQTRGINMATYVATNVHFDTTSGYVFAVQATFRDTISIGGVKMVDWTGVEDVYPTALGAFHSDSVVASTPTPIAPGPITIGAGSVAYGVTLSNGGVNMQSRPTPNWVIVGGGIGSSPDGRLQDDGGYFPPGGGGSINPQWTWDFQRPSAALATVLELRAATSSTSGNLTVTASTSGSSLDPDGYTVTVDGGSPRAIGINASTTYTGLTAGTHTVAISGVASNCTVSGGTSQTPTVPSGGTATTTFTVTCSATTGDLTTTTSTTGTNPDPDGYTATVDGTTQQPIPSSGSVTFTGLTSGNHSVALSGVATNCSVNGGPSQTVMVPSGGTATAAFTVGCSATTGGLTVTASTSGSSLDPDGYTVTVDGGSPQALAINGSVSYTSLTASSHTVAISGVAANCTVSGGASQTVTVPSGGTATATFTVSCSATTGDLTVTASTTGSSLDPDGYAVTVDGGSAQTLAINGSVSYPSLTAGSHTVAISGVAANCTVTGGTSQTVSVPAGGTATATFGVTCSTPAGNLTVSASTSGSSLDPDGYTVTVDGGSPQPLAINGSVSYTNLTAANHTVAISGVASTCTVSGSSSRTVNVPSGGTATTTFTVTCSTPPGNLTATTSTSGSNVDPDGYTVAVDGGPGQAISINGSITFTGLAAGSHDVVLGAVAANCTVSGGATQSVSVPSGGTATAAFSVSCAATTGDLTVTTSTSGSSLDPDGYTVTVDGTTSQPITINGSVTFTGLAGGSHTVVLSGVAGNCTVSGGASQTATVPAGGTATLGFVVTCTVLTGDLTVTTSTTGSSLDPDGYTVTVDGGSPQAIGINASVTYTSLAAGNHTVAISGVAANCSVSGGTSHTVSVPSGSTATTTFTITCTTPPGNLTVSASTSGSSLDPDGYTVTVDGGSPQALAINGSVSYTNLTAGNHTVAISGVAANCAVSGGTSQTVNVPSGGTATTTFTVTCTTPPGNLTVSASTSGSSLDPDGYTVTVDGGSPQALAINGSVSYTNLAAGNHTVAISGVAGNCAVSGGASRTVSVPSGGTATTTFTVTCTTPPGNLTVSASTTGSSLDPDGYTVTVDGGSPQALAINGSVSYTNLAAGNHTVAISGVAGNCTVSGGTSRTVSVPSGGSATTTFTVTCTTPPGNLTVSASTSGSSLDPDGYTVAVDGGAGQALAINGSVTFTSLSAGNHSVQLSGVAANCTVSGSNPRTVSVPSGGTATTTFTVSCVTPPGNLTVSARTSGSSLDPDGYTVTVDGGSPQALAINGSVSYTNLSAGNHTVAISGVASNCTVSGGTSRTVSVPSGGTGTTTFTVSCVTPPGNLTVSASTSGSSLDPDGYTVTVDGGSPQALAINGSVSYTNLSAGNHTVAISGVASNCTVSGGTSRTVSVPSGGTATTTFTVSCVTPPGNLTVSASTSGSSLDPDGYTVTVDGGSSQALAINGSVSYTNLTAGNHTVAISGVASNCTVSGGTSRTVSVPSGGTATTTFTVSCVTPNQAPVVNAGADEQVLLGVLWTTSFSFSDPDNGPWNYTIDWGDGSTSSGSRPSAGSFSATHTYLGILTQRTIRVTITDSLGASGSDTRVITLIL